MSKGLLERAIERLLELREKSTQGEWRHYQDNEYYSTISPVGDLSDIAHVGLTPMDAELIVTLHRTIEPILDMLEHCVEWLGQGNNEALCAGSEIFGAQIEPEINIANAILGVSDVS